MSITKTPWRFYKNPKTDVCLVSGGDKAKNQSFVIMTTSNEANARLISAAPDMLEALKKIKYSLEFFMENTYDNEPPDHNDMKMIKDAIAKADGKNNETD